MIKKIAFGGGCHWCTEAVFQSLIGVSKVEQGWVASSGGYDSFSEAVVVHYDETLIPQSVLISIHLRTHSCTSTHQLRSKYRSAVYVFDLQETKVAQDIITKLQPDFDQKIITMVLPMVGFKSNKPEYLDYYYSNPDKEFCQRYIDPKIKFLLENYRSQVDRLKLVVSKNNNK